MFGATKRSWNSYSFLSTSVQTEDSNLFCSFREKNDTMIRQFSELEYLYTIGTTNLTKSNLTHIHADIERSVKRRAIAVRPILRVKNRNNKKNERPEICGSGVLLRIDREKLYLLSAAHVLRPLEPEPLFIGTKSSIIPLGGKFLPTPLPANKDPEHDAIDIALMRLDDETTAAFSEHCALQLKDLAVDDLSQPGHIYFMTGNTYSRSDTFAAQNKIRAPLLICVGEASLTKWYGHFHVRTETHVISAHDPDNCVGPNGTRKPSPKLNGASGAALWRYCPDDISSQPHLAGIFLAAHKNPAKVLIAAKSVLFAAALSAMEPTLATAIPQSSVVHITIHPDPTNQ